jgi:exodeoxyribonuclease VII large subunit
MGGDSVERSQIFSVKEINRYIKMKLEGDSLLQDVWIRGEISNFTHHSSGHMYFTLKDADGRLKCVMFAKQSQKLAFLPREGTRVLARGTVSVYERDGQYQFYVSQMQPDGIGSLYLAFEQLKQRLEQEGLFAPERKKKIPAFPAAIGVITSPTGAAIRDIVTTLQRRYPAAAILLYPVLVQGQQAAPSIARAIREMNRLREVDVLIVGRGGGSLEELWAFNEEVVARSIAASDIPVISAVGHETDFTIADFVADLRAATPTAAAELAVPHHLELRQRLTRLKGRLQQGLLHQLQVRRERLRSLRRSPVFQNPRRYLLQPAERLDRLRERLVYRMRHRTVQSSERWSRLDKRLGRHNPYEQAIFARRRVQTAERLLVQAMMALVKEKRNRWTSEMRQLDALSPLKIMQRGYSLAYDEKGKRLIKSIHQVQIGDLLKLRLTDGRINCHVWSMEGEADEQTGGRTEF